MELTGPALESGELYKKIVADREWQPALPAREAVS